MTTYERIKAMNIDEMSEFLGFFNFEEDICSGCNAKTGAEICRTHTCVERAKKFLEKDGESDE